MRAWIDQISDLLGKTIAWLTLFMALTTGLIVILRYGFNIGFIALQESVVYMHAAVLMLAMGYTLKHDQHVRVDIVYRRCSSHKRAIIDLIGTLLFLLPFSGFVFISCLDYVIAAWQLKEGSAEANGLPYVYLLKSLLLVFPVTLILQALASLLHNIKKLYHARLTNNHQEQP